MKSSSLLVLLTLLLLSCRPTPTASSSRGDLEERVSVLEFAATNQSAHVLLQADIDILRDQLSLLSNQVAVLRPSAFADLPAAIPFSVAAVTPDDPAWQPLETPVGRLLLSTKSLERYLDGYKIHFSIGNPLAMALSDLELSVHWGSRHSQSRTNRFPGTFEPGTWTPVECIVTPVSLDHLRQATVSAAVGATVARTPTR